MGAIIKNRSEVAFNLSQFKDLGFNFKIARAQLNAVSLFLSSSDSLQKLGKAQQALVALESPFVFPFFVRSAIRLVEDFQQPTEAVAKLSAVQNRPFDAPRPSGGSSTFSSMSPPPLAEPACGFWQGFVKIIDFSRAGSCATASTQLWLKTSKHFFSLTRKGVKAALLLHRWKQINLAQISPYLPFYLSLGATFSGMVKSALSIQELSLKLKVSQESDPILQVKLVKVLAKLASSLLSVVAFAFAVDLSPILTLSLVFLMISMQIIEKILSEPRVQNRFYGLNALTC